MAIPLIKTLTEGTFFLLKDEKALSLAEVNLMTPDYSGIHRYQVIVVIRDDRPVQCKIDLGLAKKFKADQFRLVGGGKDDSGKYWAEETVASLQNMADYMRNVPIDYGDIKLPKLLDSYANLCEERRKRRKYGN